MKKVRYAKIICAICLITFTTGCQPPPDKEAIISKSEGLAKTSVAEPLEGKEKQILELPDGWKNTYERANGSISIWLNVELGSIECGNLSVLEVSPRNMRNEELNDLLNYFGGQGKFYQVPKLTKGEIEKWLKQIENKEGKYGNPYLNLQITQQTKKLNELLETAKETTEDKEVKSEFTNYLEPDRTYITKTSISNEVFSEAENTFQATEKGGKAPGAYFFATDKNDEAGTTSCFTYTKGTGFNETDLASREWYLQNADKDYPGNEWLSTDKKLLEEIKGQMEEITFSLDEAEKMAKQVLEDLNVSDMMLAKTEKTVWYTQLNADRYLIPLEEAELGYTFLYYRSVNGLPAYSVLGSAASVPENTYTPPFEQEKVEIVVTEKGVQHFSWENMAEVKGIVTLNTKLLEFNELKEKIIDHLYYLGVQALNASGGEESGMKVTIDVSNMELRYGYTTAFGNPSNAWLVPVWVIKQVTKNEMGDISISGVEEEEMISALDGGYIVPLTYMKIK